MDRRSEVLTAKKLWIIPLISEKKISMVLTFDFGIHAF